MLTVQPYNSGGGGLSAGAEHILILLTALLSLLGVLGNLAVLYVLRSSEQRTGRKVPSNVFIRNLALTDFLIGFLIFPLLTFTLADGRQWSLSKAVCLIHGVLVSILINVSIFSLTGIAMDRYLAVIQPIYYKVILTKQRARNLVLVFWITSIIIALLPFAFGISYTFSRSSSMCTPELTSTSSVYLLVHTLLTIVIPFIILAYCYIRIYTEFRVRSVQRKLCTRAKRLSIQVLEWGATLHTTHTRTADKTGNTPSFCATKTLQTVREETNSSESSGSYRDHVDLGSMSCTRRPAAELSPHSGNHSSGEGILSSRSFYSQTDLKAVMKKVFSKKAKKRGTPKCMRNASVTARLIIVCFLCCWTPYICKTIYTLVHRPSSPDQNSWYLYFHIIVSVIALSNCAWNPMIYLSRSATYKKEIARILIFRMKPQATAPRDVLEEIPVPMRNIHRKLSVIAGIEPSMLPIRRPSSNRPSPVRRFSVITGPPVPVNRCSPAAALTPPDKMADPLGLSDRRPSPYPFRGRIFSQQCELRRSTRAKMRDFHANRTLSEEGTSISDRTRADSILK